MSFDGIPYDGPDGPEGFHRIEPGFKEKWLSALRGRDYLQGDGSSSTVSIAISSPNWRMYLPDAIITRIQALLAQAESTTFDAEAEVFYAKAQELMIQHAIDEQMLRDAMPAEQREKPVVKTVTYSTTSANRLGRAQIMEAVASNNRCRAVFHSGSTEEAKKVTLVGFQADIDFCVVLNASLYVQAYREAKRKNLTARQTTAFYSGFATEVRARLRQFNRVAEEKAPTPGNALALRDVRTQVNEVYDEAFEGKTHTRSYRADYRAYHSGRDGGTRADISGGRRNLGSTRALSR